MEKLAIDGGQPVRPTMLNYSRHWIDTEDIATVVKVLEGDWLTTGPNVRAFENAVADYTGAKYAVAVNTGTAALHGSVYSAGIGPGDEVIVTPLTFVASANCILYVGAKPVFADIDTKTLNINPEEVEKKITEKTKAIIAVDLCGQPCDHNKLREIATKHNLTVIQDASHSLGATYHGNKVGTLQDMTTLSFHPVKHITTGEGGMVLLNDEQKADKLRSFRHHGIDIDFYKRGLSNLWLYDVVNLGFNYRITDISCALGISQLKKLDKWLTRRREIVAQYNQAFSTIPEIEIPHVDPHSESAWHLYMIRLNLGMLQFGRERIFKALRAENIGVNVHYIPIPSLGLYKEMGYHIDDYPIAKAEYERLITIPLFPMMTDNDVENVISAIKKVIFAYRS